MILHLLLIIAYVIYITRIDIFSHLVYAQIRIVYA